MKFAYFIYVGLILFIFQSSVFAAAEMSEDEIDREIQRIENFELTKNDLHQEIQRQFKGLRSTDIRRSLLLSAGVGFGLSASGMAMGKVFQMPMEQSLLASVLVSIFGIFPGMILFTSGSVDGEKLTGVRNAFHYEIAEFHRYWSHSRDSQGLWIIDRPVRFNDKLSPRDLIRSVWKKIERLDELREELEKRYLLGSLSASDHDRFQVSIDYFHSFYTHQLLKLLHVQLDHLRTLNHSSSQATSCETTLRQLTVFRGR